MSTERYFSFLEQMTKKLADTFLEINELCKQEIIKARQQMEKEQNVIEKPQQKQEVALKANQIEIQSEEEQGPAKSDKTKKIKKETINDDEQKQSNTAKGKKKVKKVSHKPKAPPSSFLLFFKDQQGNISKAYPTYGVTELTKVAAKLWSEYSADLKEPYIKQCDEQRKIYQERMQVYRKEFPQEIAQKQKDRLNKRKMKNGKQTTPKKEKVQSDPSKVKNQDEGKTQPNGTEPQKIIIEEEISDSEDPVEEDSLGMI